MSVTVYIGLHGFSIALPSLVSRAILRRLTRPTTFNEGSCLVPLLTLPTHVVRSQVVDAPCLGALTLFPLPMSVLTRIPGALQHDQRPGTRG